MKEQIEKILNSWPEVTWDRWAGDEHNMQVFGWLKRLDSHKDFVFLWIVNGVVVNYCSSSPDHTKRFAEQNSNKYYPCQRVEDVFKNVNSVKLK